MRLENRWCAPIAIALLLSSASLGAQTRRSTPPPPPPVPGVILDERAVYMSAAQTAWAFVERNYVSSTGLARAHDSYQYLTVWDIASLLAATYSAHGLGLITDAVYHQRTQKALATLGSMALFEGVAFNKMYDAHTGRMVGRDLKNTSRGIGWSAIDLGRFLVWLRIVAVSHPQHMPQAQAIVNRLNMARLISDGYLRGEDLAPGNGAKRIYPEGKMGYEQYAAAGFALWGFRAEKALDQRVNALPVSVQGVSLFADTRGNEYVTSEPYIMLGLETGWYSPEVRAQAWRVLAAQEARYRSTGTITMVSEDALPDPPYYFYYYNVYRQGRPFSIDGPPNLGAVQRPRWISTKAAFAWHALLPSPYTLLVLQAVQSSEIPGRGWGAGVYEGTLRPTGTPGINTEAIILEAALYQMRGGPFLNQRIQ
ncbi:MAG TPA: DUF3131 domain-containing protein [Gemmatimonadaceae bacterium]|nr:DUF3131 domain-containing protein [Gemmatimonadaceae bacterium]